MGKTNSWIGKTLEKNFERELKEEKKELVSYFLDNGIPMELKNDQYLLIETPFAFSIHNSEVHLYSKNVNFDLGKIQTSFQSSPYIFDNSSSIFQMRPRELPDGGTAVPTPLLPSGFALHQRNKFHYVYYKEVWETISKPEQQAILQVENEFAKLVKRRKDRKPSCRHYNFGVENGNITNLNLSYWVFPFSLHETIGQLTNLQNLDISKNKIHSLPPSFGHLSTLHTLIAHHNSLSSLPSSFSNLSNLKVIDFDHNRFKDFPLEICSLPQLSNLSIRNNFLSSLPEDFSNLVNLQSLFLNNVTSDDLPQNQIPSLPSSFGNLSSLQELDLAENKIASLPSSFGNLSRLHSLNLTANNLSSLPSSFCSLSTLEVLRLYDNPLESLPKSFIHLLKLKYLGLTNTNDGINPWGTDPPDAVNDVLVSKVDGQSFLDIIRSNGGEYQL